MTNLRQWVIVARVKGPGDTARSLHDCGPRKKHSGRLVEKSQEADGGHWRIVQRSKNPTRVLLQAAPLTAPKEVAWFLGLLRARRQGAYRGAGEFAGFGDAAHRTGGGARPQIHRRRGGAFLPLALVQTFSTASSPPGYCGQKHNPGAREKFNWHEAAWSLHVPMIKTLFEQIAMPTKLQPLGLVEVLDWTQTALNRVDRAASFPSSRKIMRSSISTSRSWRLTTRNCARGWAYGIPRRKSCGTWSPASIPCCARNWKSRTDWPTRTCTCSTRAAAPGPS